MNNLRQDPDYADGRDAGNRWVATVDSSRPFTLAQRFRIGMSERDWTFYCTAASEDYNGKRPSHRLMDLLGGFADDGSIMPEAFYTSLWEIIQGAVAGGKCVAFGLGFADEILRHAGRMSPMPSVN